MEQNQEDGTYAACSECGQEMRPGQGCTSYTIADKDGCMNYRIKAGDEIDILPEMADGEFCHDCNATRGQYHHLGCDMERCPICWEQLISCGCFALD